MFRVWSMKSGHKKPLGFSIQVQKIQSTFKMMYLAGLCGFLLMLTAEAGVGNSTASSYCNETPECLLFELVCQTKDYEIRRYDSVTWVSTSFTSPSLMWWFGVVPAFWRLKNYLDDNNIPMKVAPVIVEIPAEDPPQTNSNSWMGSLISKLPKMMREYTISFLLPAALQNGNAPAPTNPKVKIDVTPERYMYVRSYKGWVKDDDKEAKALLTSLNMKPYETDHYAVGYNSPMNRNPHSEVWIVADGTPQCPSK